MKSIILIIIAVALDLFDEGLGGFLAKFKRLRNWRWLHQMTAALEKSLGAMSIWNGPVGVIVTALLPLAVLGFIYGFINKPVFGLFGMIVSVLLLIYSMGPIDLMPQLNALLVAITGGNSAEADQQAQAIAGTPGPIAAGERAKASAVNALVAGNERAFGPICWFAVLGWPGAVLFRIVSELRSYKSQSAGFTEGASLVYSVLNWIPARLSAVAYALSGNASKGLKSFKLLDTLGLNHNNSVITNVGMAALETTGSEADQTSAVTAMLQKAMFVFIGLLVVLQIIAWMI